MLRSLVGSEMCIRDSLSLARQFVNRGLKRSVTDAMWHDLVAAGASRYFNCLLYTSDAADDLLCVDLGGRRILKKKKHIHTHTARKYPTALNQHIFTSNTTL